MTVDDLPELIDRLSGLSPSDAFALLCRWPVDALPVDGAGLSLIIDGEHRGCLSASNPMAARVEEMQFRTGEGPGLDAHRLGSIVVEADLAHSARWPLFAADALADGIVAVCAVPLRVGSARFGTLSLYRDRPGSLTHAMLADAQAIADIATALVLDVQADAHGGLAAVFEDLFAHRAVVHQATGMVSIQLDVGLVDALVALRAHAYSGGQTVQDVSRAIVARTVRLER